MLTISYFIKEPHLKHVNHKLFYKGTSHQTCKPEVILYRNLTSDMGTISYFIKEPHLKLLCDLRSVQEQARVEAVHGPEVLGELAELLEHFGVHGGRHDVLGGDVIIVSLAELLLHGLEVHRGQRGTGATIHTG